MLYLGKVTSKSPLHFTNKASHPNFDFERFVRSFMNTGSEGLVETLFPAIGFFNEAHTLESSSILIYFFRNKVFIHEVPARRYNK